jgi:hypothetical protein
MEADCWSVKNGRDAGLFNRQDVEAFAPYLAQSKGSPFGHLPGRAREAYLLKCFDDASPNASTSASAGIGETPRSPVGAGW